MINPDALFGRLGNRMFQMAYVYAQVKEGKIPDMYVQNFKYFEECSEDIKNMFGGDIGKRINKVAIHVRRGDYLKAPHNTFHANLCASEYYQDAMKLFPRDTFLVFSDDIEFCKGYFQGDRFEFSEGKTEIEDMNLIAACKAQIIANSSFSFWGAYISPYSDMIVAPKDFYCDRVERTILPKTWIRL